MRKDERTERTWAQTRATRDIRPWPSLQVVDSALPGPALQTALRARLPSLASRRSMGCLIPSGPREVIADVRARGEATQSLARRRRYMRSSRLKNTRERTINWILDPQWSIFGEERTFASARDLQLCCMTAKTRSESSQSS